MKEKVVKISEPQTPKEFEAYYLVRYETLRKPWNQPIGSEKDELEDQSIHLMAVDENNNVCGVCRLQFNSSFIGQLRFMGVLESAHGLGIGKKLVAYIEKKAKENGIQIIILHSRETAVPFYNKCGYSVIEKSYLMWGEIQHFLMSKTLL